MSYYFLHIIALLFLFWWYSKKFVETSDKLYFIFGSLAKVFSGLVFWFIIVVVFGSQSDTISYLEASIVWKELFYENPLDYVIKFFTSSESISGYFTGQPRAVFFTKIVSLVSLITGGSYLLNTIYFSIISFAGSWFLFKRLSSISWQKRNVWWSLLFVFPGLMFWASGILKETVVIVSLFGMTGVYIGYKKQLQGRFLIDFLVMILSAILLIKTKYYVAAVFIPLLAFAFYYEFIKRNHQFNKGVLLYTLPVLLGVTAIFFVMNLSPNFEPGNLLNRIVIDHNRLLKLSHDADFRINFNEFTPDYLSFLRNSPMAIFSGLFRPLVWEGSSLLQIIAGLQNTLLLVIVILATIQQLLYKKKPSLEVMLLLGYSLIMATFLAFSTPNFGTLERYKILYQPFLLIALSSYLKQVSSTGKLLLRSTLKGKDQ